jgi:hypothetical protein
VARADRRAKRAFRLVIEFMQLTRGPSTSTLRHMTAPARCRSRPPFFAGSGGGKAMKGTRPRDRVPLQGAWQGQGPAPQRAPGRAKPTRLLWEIRRGAILFPNFAKPWASRRIEQGLYGKQSVTAGWFVDVSTCRASGLRVSRIDHAGNAGLSEPLVQLRVPGRAGEDGGGKGVCRNGLCWPHSRRGRQRPAPTCKGPGNVVRSGVHPRRSGWFARAAKRSSNRPLALDRAGRSTTTNSCLSTVPVAGYMDGLQRPRQSAR